MNTTEKSSAIDATDAIVTRLFEAADNPESPNPDVHMASLESIASSCGMSRKWTRELVDGFILHGRAKKSNDGRILWIV